MRWRSRREMLCGAVDVDHHLVAEVCVVVLGIEFELLVGDGEVERCAQAVVPRFFLLQVVPNEE